MARDGSDHAEAVDKAIGRVEPAIAPKDVDVAAVPRHGDGWLPLVVVGSVIGALVTCKRESLMNCLR